MIHADHPTDVEQIGHPKGDLKRLWRGFDEKKHAEPILSKLDIEHVLSRPTECCWLRAMFAWCVAKLSESGAILDPTLVNAFCLADGCKASMLSGQSAQRERNAARLTAAIIPKHVPYCQKNPPRLPEFHSTVAAGGHLPASAVNCVSW